jgi:NitT/TauT family transport system substrate-binding protein
MNSKKITRRSLLKAGAIAVGSLAAPTFYSPAVAKSRKKLRIGYLPITDATPLLIAHANGFFKDEGIQSELPIRLRSWSTLAESFITGKFDVTHLLLPIPIWMRFKNKAPVKVLAWDHTNGSALTVKADSGINSFADLGGKQIAVPYWYSMHNIILQMGLKNAGLTPVIQTQAKFLPLHQVNLFVLSPPEMPAALAGNKIDGYIVAEPFNALAEMRIQAKIMRFTGDIWKNHPCCVVVMQEMLIKEDPIFTQKVINAIVRAQLWVKNNPLQTAHILSKADGKYLPVSSEVLERVFTKYDLATYGKPAQPTAIHNPEWNANRIGFQPFPYPSATHFITEKMKDTLMEGDNSFLHSLNPGFVEKDLVDNSFALKAISLVGGPSKFDEIDLNNPWIREEIISL